MKDIILPKSIPTLIDRTIRNIEKINLSECQGCSTIDLACGVMPRLYNSYFKCPCLSCILKLSCSSMCEKKSNFIDLFHILEDPHLLLRNFQVNLIQELRIMFGHSNNTYDFLDNVMIKINHENVTVREALKRIDFRKSLLYFMSLSIELLTANYNLYEKRKERKWPPNVRERSTRQRKIAQLRLFSR